MNDWKKLFTVEQLAMTEKVWEGKPPKECRGKCNIDHTGWLGDACTGCTWDDLPRGVE